MNESIGNINRVCCGWLCFGSNGKFFVLHYGRLQAPVIRSENFQLVDGSGQVVSEWGADKYGNPLLAFGLWTNNNTGTRASSPVPFSMDVRESQGAAIGLTGDRDPFFLFRGRDAKPRVNLYVDEFGKASILFYDSNSWKLFLGANGNDTLSPEDNGWSLAFNPDVAGMGINTAGPRGKRFSQGYSYAHPEKIRSLNAVNVLAGRKGIVEHLPTVF